MRFLFVASGPLVPSTRYRIEQYLPALRDAGHRCDVVYSYPPKYDYFRFLGWRNSQKLKRSVRHYHAWLARRRDYHAILIEREVFDDDTYDLEQKFRQSTSRLVLDVDDGVFLRHSKKFDVIARMCDVAIAGNESLREYLEPRTKHTVLIPTCVSLADYQPRPDSTSNHRPTVGWIGTPHNVAFLSVAAPALRSVAKRHRFRLLIVTAINDSLPKVDLTGVDVEYRAWDPNRDIADLHEMDIGLMPLPMDQDWMKYKCALKLLQYLAVGTPGIASPVGVNVEIMKGDKVGRLAADDQQWEAALEELLGDRELRARLGAAGRELVREKFSIETNWRLLERVLTGVETRHLEK